MLNKKILKSILNVKHTAIDDMKILPDGTIAIKAHPTKGEQCRCGICGRKSVRYDNGRGGTRSWRTCDWNTIGPVISRMRAELDANPAARFAGLIRIGVDETSYKKGYKHITVVINHDTGKVIWTHEGHGKTIFTKFFKLLSKEQLANIQLVSGDGAKWIQECINDFCPAAKRCIDPFHVVQWATEALDEVRRLAWRDALKNSADKTTKERGRPKKGAPKKLRFYYCSDSNIKVKFSEELPSPPHCLFFVQKIGQRLFFAPTDTPTSMHSTLAN